jgi:hypothetical protein
MRPLVNGGSARGSSSLPARAARAAGQAGAEVEPGETVALPVGRGAPEPSPIVPVEFPSDGMRTSADSPPAPCAASSKHWR